MKYRVMSRAMDLFSASLDKVGDSLHFRIETVQFLAKFAQPSVKGFLRVCRHASLDELAEELGNTS
ncbi:MAG TPA: hypothetical protein VLE22_10280 [Bryobacteraceae bacterium]|nr:hypothetical protein [Bryobacteraceae bacterium]